MEARKTSEGRGAEHLQESPTRLLKSIKKRVAELSQLGPEIIGSLCSRPGKCKNPDCDCHKGVPMHLSWQLTSTEKGRTKTVYVPLAALDKVQEWAKNHKLGRKLRKEVSDLCERYLRTVVPRERAVRRRNALEKPLTEGEE